MNTTHKINHELAAIAGRWPRPVEPLIADFVFPPQIDPEASLTFQRDPATGVVTVTRNGPFIIPCPCARCEADRTEQPTAYDLRLLRVLDVAIKVLLVAIAVGFFAVVVHAVLSGAAERLVVR